MLPNTYTTPLHVKNFVYNNNSKSFNVFAKIRRIVMSSVEDSGFIFSRNLVVVDSAFSGDVDIEVRFTSATAFEVRLSDGDEFKSLLIGSGVISSDFVVTDVCTLGAGTFGGVINTGDVMSFGITRSLSEDQLASIIYNAEVEVDSFARSTGLIYEPLGSTKAFGPIPEQVPPEITLAATKWAVSLMIQHGMLQITATSNPEISHYEALRNSARKNITQYGMNESRGRPVVAQREDLGNSNGTTKKTLTEFLQSTTEYDNVDPTVEFTS